MSSHRLDDLVSDVERALRRRDMPDADEAARVGQATLRVHAAALDFFRLVAQVSGDDAPLSGAAPPAGRRRAGAPGLFDERRRVTADSLDAAGEAGLTLIGALDALEGSIGLVKDAREDVAALKRRAGELRDDVRFLMRADDPAFVYFVESRGTGIFLRALPIDVSGLVRERLFGRLRTTVLTSATLRVGESFDYVASRLGIGENAKRSRSPPSSITSGSRSSTCRAGCPTRGSRSSPPGSPTKSSRSSTGQRAAPSCCSPATPPCARRATGWSGRSPIPCSCRDPPRAACSSISSDARRTPCCSPRRASGRVWTSSARRSAAWSSTSCRSPRRAIPSSRPGWKPSAARGGDPFAEYQVPLAILTLRQGLGRLLRHRDDRGVLAILDPRLQTMGYGRRFLASLPSSPITRELEEITRFFARGERASLRTSS